MTKQQQEEFAKLELAYLDEVRANNTEGQLRAMEVIFYWLKKQITAARMEIIVGMPGFQESPSEEITADQKGEFTFLQMAMIGAAYKAEPDRVAMAEIELKMREWIDKQITASVNRLIKPKMKIVRDNGKP